LKRRPLLFAVGVGLATSLASLAGFAQGIDEFGAYGGLEDRKHNESGQSVAVEFRFGRYVPRVDSEFDGATPYRDLFGTGNRYLLGLEIDWQALRIPYLGTLGPGFGWGLTKSSADAFLADGTGERAKQKTTLNIMPMYVVGVLRADVVARETLVPLVPYAKAGFGYALWWVGDGEDTARTDDGVKGQGASYGYQFALGGMLLLDFFDPRTAVEADNSIGINNSYLFMEWYYSDLSGLGSNNRMQVGTSTWMLGLVWEI
jgi:hypothetical protein